MFFRHFNEGSRVRPLRRERRIKILGSASVLLLVIGLFFALQPHMAMNPWASYMMVGVVLLAIFANAAIILRNSQLPLEFEKRKRGFGGQDMYVLIDRMVENLDADELDYLRSRLEQVKHEAKQEAAESLDELLLEREEARQKRRR